MKADLELTLTHEGDTWRVYNDTYVAEGETFKTLDEQLAMSIKRSGSYPQGSRIKVFMGFNGQPLGYSARFFNRYIDLEI